jgi:hypothetical protein
MPITATGVELALVEPFPSWPYMFDPQHWTPPFTSAQEWAPLAEPFAATALVVPTVRIGGAPLDEDDDDVLVLDVALARDVVLLAVVAEVDEPPAPPTPTV